MRGGLESKEHTARSHVQPMDGRATGALGYGCTGGFSGTRRGLAPLSMSRCREPLNADLRACEWAMCSLVFIRK